jgi:hypothetical protein
MIDDMVQNDLVFYEQGKAYLLSGEPYESLRVYVNTLQITHKEQDLEEAFNAINSVSNHERMLGYEWVRELLLIGLAVKFPMTDAGKAAFEQIKKIASKPNHHLEEPIVIVAGGCSTEVEAKMQTYKSFILETFRDFNGIIISGGTSAGVSGLIGQVQQNYPKSVQTIGYVPNKKIALVDKRYSQIRFTKGEKFSPIEPLQYWIDILASGIMPAKVKVLGINGGRISSLEYRMALAFGAQVAIVKDSGMEADKLLLDPNWNTNKDLIPISTDLNRSREFIQLRKE